MSAIHRDEVEVLPHVCETCGKAFRNLQGLSGHKLVHQPTPPCPECRQEFTTPSAQARHRLKEHGVPLKGKYVKVADREITPDEWTADDIMETVIMSMYPNGSLPVRAVIPFIRWREATSELLATLRSV